MSFVCSPTDSEDSKRWCIVLMEADTDIAWEVCVPTSGIEKNYCSIKPFRFTRFFFCITISDLRRLPQTHPQTNLTSVDNYAYIWNRRMSTIETPRNKQFVKELGVEVVYYNVRLPDQYHQKYDIDMKMYTFAPSGIVLLVTCNCLYMHLSKNRYLLCSIAGSVESYSLWHWMWTRSHTHIRFANWCLYYKSSSNVLDSYSRTICIDPKNAAIVPILPACIDSATPENTWFRHW